MCSCMIVRGIFPSTNPLQGLLAHFILGSLEQNRLIATQDAWACYNMSPVLIQQKSNGHARSTEDVLNNDMCVQGSNSPTLTATQLGSSSRQPAPTSRP